MILALAAIPALLWGEGPQTAPALERAGIHEIAITGDAGAWSSTKVRVRTVDAGSLVKLDPPGVDYQIGRGGATAAPWIISNVWQMMREHGKSFVYEVSGSAISLAIAEVQAAGATAYLKIKPADLELFARSASFAMDHDSGGMTPLANFGLVDDGSPPMAEIMNLLARRNLLFRVVKNAGEFKGPVVRLGSSEYPAKLADDPYVFAAAVRSRIGDDQRLVRLYGSETTLAKLYGDARHARLYLIQYGRGAVSGIRVRVRGHYPRVMIASQGTRLDPAEDIVVDDAATEFTIPELKNYAVIDLDSRGSGELKSKFSEHDFELTADPSAPHWREAPLTKIDTDVHARPVTATEIRSRWTRGALYLLYTCPYRSLSLHPSPVTDRETNLLWNWDTAEAFIGSDMTKIGQYREFEVSPQGEWVDLDIDVEHSQPGGGIGWNSGFTVKARIDEAHRIWYGEMRIPLASIADKKFQTGDRLRLGLFRLGGTANNRELNAWQPPFRGNFHTPEAFGTLLLN